MMPNPVPKFPLRLVLRLGSVFLAIFPATLSLAQQKRGGESIWQTIGNAINSLVPGDDFHTDAGASSRHVVKSQERSRYEAAVRTWNASNGKFGSGFVLKGSNELVRRVDSRGGESRYGSNFNRSILEPLPPQNPPTSAPPKSPPPHQLVGGSVWHGWRIGYVAYSRDFVDDLFAFGFYAFQPTAAGCKPSPFYDYANLPPYIDASQVNPSTDQPNIDVATVTVARDGTKTTVINNARDPRGLTGTTIVTEYPDGYKELRYVQLDGSFVNVPGHILDGPTPSVVKVLPPQRGDMDLKTALADLRLVWEKDDEGAIDRLIPRSGFVQVRVADVGYRLSASDFFDLFHDGVDNTKTVGFGIVTQSESGSEVQVEARHEIHDPWSAPRQITQRYKLVRESNGYMIRSFESEPYPKN